MSSVAQIAQLLRAVLEEEANRLGRESGWQQRQRALSGADFVQTLLFGWWQDPQISLDGLTQVAGRRLVQMSASGLHQRFTPEAAQLLFQILTQLVEAHFRQPLVETLPFVRAFPAVLLEDSSTIALTRRAGADLAGQRKGRREGERPSQRQTVCTPGPTQRNAGRPCPHRGTAHRYP